MEPAGLALGVAGLAGLFSACIEAVERVQTYKEYRTDSHILNVRFAAAKASFEQWGKAVGIKDGMLDHPALDEQAPAITELLHVIIKFICDPSNASKSLINQDHPNRSYEPSYRSSPSESKLQKLTWSLLGKKRRTDQVDLFEKLVEQLHKLVPPDSLVAGVEPGARVAILSWR